MDFSLSSSLVGTTVLSADKLALDLQFATDKTLTARTGPTPVFTRASTGRFVGSNGLIQSAAINAPRFDHDPVTGVCKGLLMEESRTNLVTHSDQFNNIAWSKNGSIITENATASPDGTVNAERTTEQSGTSTRFGTFFTITPALSTAAYTFSVFIKNASGSRFARIVLNADAPTTFACVDVNPSTGQISQTLNSSVSAVSSSSVAAGDGWWRVSITATLPARYVTIALITGSSVPAGVDFGYQSYTGNGTSGIFIWGAQLEAGSFPTSYIPTTTASVVRSADVCSITGSAFSGFYNQPEGTLFADVTPQSVDQISVVVGVNTFSSTRSHFIYKINSAINAAGKRWGAQTVNDAGAQTAIPTLTDVAISRTRLAYSYKLNDFAFVYAGVIVGTDTIGTIPVPTAMRIGSRDDGLYINGHIASVRYYKKRLLNAKLQAITV